MNLNPKYRDYDDINFLWERLDFYMREDNPMWEGLIARQIDWLCELIMQYYYNA